jgi:hypothetical protein
MSRKKIFIFIPTGNEYFFWRIPCDHKKIKNIHMKDNDFGVAMTIIKKNYK